MPDSGCKPVFRQLLSASLPMLVTGHTSAVNCSHMPSNTSWPRSMPEAPGGCLQTACLQLLLLARLVKGGGELAAKVCSNIRAAGPPSPKADAQRPIVVRDPLSSASADCSYRPALGQQHGLPPLPFPGRRRQNHPPPQVLDFHLPLF